MNTQVTRNPLAILHDMERRSRANGVGMPQREEAPIGWSGIAFRVADQRLLVHTDEILEILTYPALTRVPGTQAWVKGIANIRGNLLPVMDLGGFLNGRRTAVGRNTRVLVINQHGVYVGLVVDEVLGQRQFQEEERFNWESPPGDEPLDEGDDAFDAIAAEGFRRGNEVWRVFRADRLTNQTRFMQVAV